MVVNSQTKVPLDLADVRAFVRKLREVLRLERQHFNVCFVDDSSVQRLNAEFRGKGKPTDVLSFPWTPGEASLQTDEPGFGKHSSKSQVPSIRPSGSLGREIRWGDEFKFFLGDIAISAETARRNAALAGHSTRREIRVLILHGLLHLLGYDHERDHGEMTRLELSLRGRAGIAGPSRASHKSRIKKQEAKTKTTGIR